MTDIPTEPYGVLPMETNDNQMLVRVFSDVFEEFAFMFAEAGTDWPEPTDVAGPFLMAEIRFEGRDKKGLLEVAAPLEICRELAENILGAEPDELPPEAGENALTELLNVCCGYFLAEKYGTGEAFDLSIPSTRPVSAGQWARMAEEGRHVRMRVDESPLLARFVVQGGEQSARNL